MSFDATPSAPTAPRRPTRHGRAARGHGGRHPAQRLRRRQDPAVRRQQQRRRRLRPLVLGLNAPRQPPGCRPSRSPWTPWRWRTAKTSNAPAALTEAQIVDIYEGTSPTGARSAAPPASSSPLIPQAGSGTRSFFTAQLKRMNGGVDRRRWHARCTKVQEHDDAPIKDDPNAIAPFSVGRAGLLGTAPHRDRLHRCPRALQRRPRGRRRLGAGRQAMFGPTASSARPARPSLIQDAGFEQLALAGQGGVCGVATTTATPASRPADRQGHHDDHRRRHHRQRRRPRADRHRRRRRHAQAAGRRGLLRRRHPGPRASLTGGKATVNLTGLAAGAHKVKAIFTPTGAAFTARASAEVDVTVLAAAPVQGRRRPSSSRRSRRRSPRARVVKGKVKVKESATGAATGKVVIKRGKKTVGKGTVKNGKVVIKLTKPLKKGKNKLIATYAGDTRVRRLEAEVHDHRQVTTSPPGPEAGGSLTAARAPRPITPTSTEKTTAMTADRRSPPYAGVDPTASSGLATLEARDITAWFGTAQGARPGLADHAGRRDHRPDRPVGLRQVDVPADPQPDARAGAVGARSPARCCSTARTSTTRSASSPTPAARSAWCSRSPTRSRRCRSTTTWWPACKLTGTKVSQVRARTRSSRTA